MELSRKYKTLLLRSKMRPIFLHKVKKLCKSASDLELVLLHDKINYELIKRGLMNE